MNLQEYISSGILEQYLLGLTSPEETAEVERMVIAHPEVKQALNSLSEEYEQFVRSQAVPLRPGLKEEITREIAAMKKSRPDLIPSYLHWILFLLGLLAALYFGVRANSLQSRLEQAGLQVDSLERQCQSRATLIALYQNPKNRIVPLAGQPSAPEAVARIHWNQQSGETFLEVLNLPAPPSGKQYQLWAVYDQGPVSMDVFNLPSSAMDLVLAPRVDNQPLAFAVSLEPAGGSPQPTADQILMIGYL